MSISIEAKTHVEARATQGNVLDKVIIDPEEYDSGRSYHTITGIWEGAIDEDFVVESTYSVNVADWLAEFYQGVRTEGESWQILVVEFFPGESEDEPDMDGDLVYKTADESFSG